VNIIEFVEDERFINQHTLSLAQKTLLKTLYGLPLERAERKAFKRCTGLWSYRPKEFK
jgi:hypothetical protein